MKYISPVVYKMTLSYLIHTYIYIKAYKFPYYHVLILKLEKYFIVKAVA